MLWCDMIEARWYSMRCVLYQIVSVFCNFTVILFRFVCDSICCFESLTDNLLSLSFLLSSVALNVNFMI